MELQLRFTGFQIKNKDSEWNHNREATFLNESKQTVRINETELIKVARLRMGGLYLITLHETLFYPIKIIDISIGIEYLFRFNKVWKHEGKEYLLLNIKASMTKKVYRFEVFVLDKLVMVVHSQHLGKTNCWTSFRNTWLGSPELINYKEQISVKLYLKDELVSEYKYNGKIFTSISK